MPFGQGSSDKKQLLNSISKGVVVIDSHEWDIISKSGKKLV